MQYENELILENIRKQDRDTLDYIYKKFYPAIRNFICVNSGNEEDAEDIFQDSIIVLYKKIRDDELELQCSFKTFLFSVSKNLWLKELDRRKIIRDRIELVEDFANIEPQDEVKVEVDDRYNLYQKHFANLSDKCQELLKLFYSKVPLREIAQKLGFSSEKYAKKRKYQCKEVLIKKIKTDPNYKNY
jgi:RNA polymerase sigma factor (sigma-70 family)